METRISTDKAGEKWLPWARRKLDQLRRLRTDLRLPKMSKAFKPTPDALVWLETSDSGDWIRVTAGQPWLVAGNTGTVVRRGYASPKKFLSVSYPMRAHVPPDSTSPSPGQFGSLTPDRHVGYRVDTPQTDARTYAVKSSTDFVMPQPATGHGYVMQRTALALRKDMVAVHYNAKPLFDEATNGLVDRRTYDRIALARWSAADKAWKADEISVDVPEMRAAINALPATARLVNDPAVATYPGQNEVMETRVQMTCAGTFTVSDVAVFGVNHNNVLDQGVTANVEYRGRYANIFNELAYVQNVALVQQGYTTTLNDGIIDPTNALGGGAKFLTARYQLWSADLITKRFAHTIDLDTGEKTLRRSETATATTYLWLQALNTDNMNAAGLYTSPTVIHGWVESGSAIANYPAFGGIRMVSSWLSATVGDVDAHGHVLEPSPKVTVNSVVAATPGSTSVPDPMFSAPATSFSPTVRNVSTVDVKYRGFKDATELWSRTFANYSVGTAGAQISLLSRSDSTWLDRYRIAFGYAEPSTSPVSVFGHAQETGIETGSFVDAYPTAFSTRLVSSSKDGTFYVNRDQVGGSVVARVYDQLDNLVYTTTPTFAAALFDYQTLHVLWVFDLLTFAVQKVTLSQGAGGLWTAAEGAVFTPPTDISLDGVPLGSSFVQILPVSVLPPGVPS